MDSRFSTSPIEIERRKMDCGLSDGRLPCSEIEFLVELSGEITILWLPFRYSLLFNPNSDLERILEDWEGVLRSRVGTSQVIRLDEYLLDEWEASEEDDWFRHPNKIEAFLSWLRGQERLHWRRRRPTDSAVR
jgi:hypothetical protein